VIKKGDPVKVRLHSGAVVDGEYDFKLIHSQRAHVVNILGYQLLATDHIYDDSCCRFVASPCVLVPVEDRV